MPKSIVIDEAMSKEGFSFAAMKTGEAKVTANQVADVPPTTQTNTTDGKAAVVNEPQTTSSIVLNKDMTAGEGILPTNDPNQPPAAGQPDVPNFSSLLKKETGGKYSSWEEIKNDLEKNSSVQFKDELSKNIYDNLSNGNIDEVYGFLSLQRRLKNLDSMKPEEVIREKLRIEHPEWDENDVNDVYQQNYGVNDEMDEKEKRRVSRETKQAERESRDFLKTKYQSFELPKIENRNTEPPIDEQQIKKIEGLRSQFLDKVNAEREKFSGFDFTVKDDDFTINTKFVVPAEDVKSYIDDLASEGKSQSYYDRLFYENYIDEKGEYKVDAMTKDLWMLRRDKNDIPNYQKVIENQIKQAFTDAKMAILSQFKGRSEKVSSVPDAMGKSSTQSEIDEYLRLTHRS